MRKITTEKEKRGEAAEKKAVKYLKKLGYKILEKNFRGKSGEIDIIVAKDDALCFVEVRSRESDSFGSPETSVNSAKQRKIISTADEYIMKKNIKNVSIRYDIISVTGPEMDMEYFPNAFQSRE